MSVIQVLSPHVADLIAAGEVVERPGSVVKELLENSFDAGAKNITVELRGGGRYVRVQDDGCGMAPEDAATAFLRHATSKLRDERGLEAIGTMGFRGEALAAIAAVSRIELITRARGADNGVRVVLEAGEVVEMHDAGCPEGTAITVRDLFFNTPARLKFMKTDRAESGYCLGLALRCALGRPEVSVRCLRDGREEFFTPGDGRDESCAYALLGRDAAAELLPCRGEDGGVAVRGFVGRPSAARGSRAAQYFFVNGRSIRSASMQAAVEQAYRNRLLPSRFPACVIYLTLSPGAVDVNVHPTKAEVKFSDEKKVFDAVYYAALSALDAEHGEKAAAPAPAPFAFTVKERDAAPMRQPVTAYRASQAPIPLSPPSPPPTSIPLHRPVPAVPRPAVGNAAHAPTPAPSVKRSAPEPEPPAAPVRLVGEAMDTYIIAQDGDSLLLIDKHAAHERIIFDRLKSRKADIMSQSLLEPATVTPGDDMELLERHGALLSELGFELEPYGEGAVVIRAVPDDIAAGDAAAALEEIMEKLRRNKSAEPESARDDVLKTMACKAAIKAGRSSEPEELLELAKRVLSGEIRYCPHGRPVSVRITKNELDKMFKRIV